MVFYAGAEWQKNPNQIRKNLNSNNNKRGDTAIARESKLVTKKSLGAIQNTKFKISSSISLKAHDNQLLFSGLTLLSYDKERS